MKINIWWVVALGIVLFIVMRSCEGKPRTITKTVTKIETIYDTINNTIIKEIPKKVYVQKVITKKGKDSIIYKNIKDENTITSSQFEVELLSNDASATLTITANELYDVQGVITYPRIETTTETIKIRDASGLYVYGQIPINNIASPEVGVLIQVRNKMFISTGVQYNNLSQQLDYKVGVGIKIW